MSANSIKQVFFFLLLFPARKLPEKKTQKKCWLRQNQLSLQDLMLAVHVSVNHTHTHTHTHTHKMFASVPNIAPSQYVLISHLSPQVVASLTELLNQQIFLTWAHFLLILVNRTRFKWNPDVFIFPTLRRLNDLQTPDVVVVWCLSCLTVCHPESLLITQCPALTLRVSHEFKRLNTASVLMCVLVYLQCRSGSRGLSQVLYSSSWWYLAACLHLCCRWFDVVFILRGTS